MFTKLKFYAIIIVMETPKTKPWNDGKRLAESVKFIASLVPILEFSTDAAWRRSFISHAITIANSDEPLETNGPFAGIIVRAAEEYLRWEYENPKDPDETDTESAWIEIEAVEHCISEVVDNYNYTRRLDASRTTKLNRR